MTTEKLTLEDIEKAIRKNFSISTKTDRFLICDFIRAPAYPHIPLVVFVGVAKTNGFERKDIETHLKITAAKYAFYWLKFIEAYNTSELSKTRGLSPNLETQEGHTYSKYRLVCNCLKPFGIDPFKGMSITD